jgi:hypothetical protein
MKITKSRVALGFVILICSACSSLRTERTRPVPLGSQAVESYMDGLLSSLRFDPSRQGDVSPDALVGQAKTQFDLWKNARTIPSAFSFNDNGTTIWTISTLKPRSELGGIYIPYIAVFLALDGSLQASGSLPISQGVKGFAWDPNPRIRSFIPVPAFQPAMTPATPDQDATSLIKTISTLFGDQTLTNKTYSGSDPEDNPLILKVAKINGGLYFSILNQTTLVDRFALDSSSMIRETNLEQFNKSAEKNDLVISAETGGNESVLWAHRFEGNAVIQIKHDDKTTSFVFHINQ